MRSALVAGTGSGRGGLRGFDAPDAAELDTLLAGLEIIELVGRGGMGFVYKARQRSLDRLVAVKLFPRDAYEDPSFAERFANEARILANLSHPNIVAAYEFGESRSYCHLVMELIAGQSLRQRIEAGPMLQPEALDIARQVCDALEYAHSRGVIHRDIKPENILLEARPGGSSPRVRVADFGLAKLVQRRSSDFSMTAPNRLMGTPDYMAPEQRQKPGEVDARADVYALGVVLYEMLTGQLPLGRFAPPTGNSRLNRIVLRCLETQPEQRYSSVAEIRRELESLGNKQLTLAWTTGAVVTILALVAGAMFAIHRWPTRQGDPRIEPRPTASIGPATSPWIEPSPRKINPPLPGPPQIWTLVPEGQQRNPMHGFDRFPTGRDDFYDRMVRDHGVNRVVRVFIDEVPEGDKPVILARLKELSGASSTLMSGTNGSVSIHLAPVRDLDALAKKIDFGKVVSIDPQKRVIEVIAAAKAP
jgi:tRNA A-37 threonylcarbamoyl transferase component Bud32